MLHSFEFAVSVKTTQNQSTLLDGRRCVPLEASSPFELPKNPTSSVLSKKGGRKPNLCPGAGRAGTLNTHTRLLALSPHSRKGEAGPVPPGAPQGRSRGGGGALRLRPLGSLPAGQHCHAPTWPLPGPSPLSFPRILASAFQTLAINSLIRPLSESPQKAAHVSHPQLPPWTGRLTCPQATKVTPGQTKEGRPEKRGPQGAVLLHFCLSHQTAGRRQS